MKPTIQKYTPLKPQGQVVWTAAEEVPNQPTKLPVVSAAEWNKVIDKVGRILPMKVATTREKWAHPWTIDLMWETSEKDETKDPKKKGQFLMRVKPGFVNGLDPEADTLFRLASKTTLARLEEEDAESGKTVDRKPDSKVSAPITERPLTPINPTMPRAIGYGAGPDIVTVTAEGNLTTSFEGVPEFFRNMGVVEATAIEGNLTSGLYTVESGDEVDEPRSLRAFDVVLYFDRLAVKIDTSQRGQPWTDGFTQLLSYTYSRSTPPKERPHLELVRKFEPPAEGDGSLLDGFADPEFDFITVATVYLLSNPGVTADQKLDGYWSYYVKYNLFWNLAHATQKIVAPIDNTPLTISTGLAVGLGDTIGNAILSPLNEGYALAALQMRAKSLAGTFWSI